MAVSSDCALLQREHRSPMMKPTLDPRIQRSGRATVATSKGSSADLGGNRRRSRPVSVLRDPSPRHACWLGRRCHLRRHGNEAGVFRSMCHCLYAPKSAQATIMKGIALTHHASVPVMSL